MLSRESDHWQWLGNVCHSPSDYSIFKRKTEIFAGDEENKSSFSRKLASRN